jgi:hypothetical protein
MKMHSMIADPKPVPKDSIVTGAHVWVGGAFLTGRVWTRRVQVLSISADHFTVLMEESVGGEMTKINWPFNEAFATEAEAARFHARRQNAFA